MMTVTRWRASFPDALSDARPRCGGNDRIEAAFDLDAAPDQNPHPPNAFPPSDRSIISNE
jgi:hypothetical protein